MTYASIRERERRDYVIIVSAGVLAAFIVGFVTSQVGIAVISGLALSAMLYVSAIIRRGPLFKWFVRRFDFRFRWREDRRRLMSLEPDEYHILRIEIEPRWRAAEITAFSLCFVATKTLWRRVPPVPADTIQITDSRWKRRGASGYIRSPLAPADFRGGFKAAFDAPLGLKRDAGLSLEVTIRTGENPWSGYLSFWGSVSDRDYRSFGRTRASIGRFSRWQVVKVTARMRWLRFVSWIKRRDPAQKPARQPGALGWLRLEQLAQQGDALLGRDLETAADAAAIRSWFQKSAQALKRVTGPSPVYLPMPIVQVSGGTIDDARDEIRRRVAELRGEVTPSVRDTEVPHRLEAEPEHPET